MTFYEMIMGSEDQSCFRSKRHASFESI